VSERAVGRARVTGGDGWDGAMRVRPVAVLAAHPPCPMCDAGPGLLCADGNRVHLRRTVIVLASVGQSRVDPDVLRLAWDRGDKGWLLWVCDPARPHLVFSRIATAPPGAGMRVWGSLEVSYVLAASNDRLPRLGAQDVDDRQVYGVPGALPPAPRPTVRP